MIQIFDVRHIHANLLAHEIEHALIVRGLEGGVISPRCRRAAGCFIICVKGEEYSVDIDPADLEIDPSVRTTPLPIEGASEESPSTPPLWPRLRHKPGLMPWRVASHLRGRDWFFRRPYAESRGFGAAEHPRVYRYAIHPSDLA